jgi:uncharacterized membrane protein (UPF0182 family)
VTSTPNRPAQSQGRPASRTRVTLTITAVVLAVLIILFFVFSGLYTDWLWFRQVGYLNVLTTQWISQFTLFWIGFFGMALPVFASIEIVSRSTASRSFLGSSAEHPPLRAGRRFSSF